MRDLLRDGLMPAVRTDATVFRAFVRAFNLLDAPDAMMADADVIGRVMAAYEERDQRPPEPPLGPPAGRSRGRPRAGLSDHGSRASPVRWPVRASTSSAGRRSAAGDGLHDRHGAAVGHRGGRGRP